MAPPILQLNWNLIRKFDHFLNYFYHKTFFMILNPLYKYLAQRVFSEKLAMIEYSDLILDNLKKNRGYLIKFYVDILDQIYLNDKVSNEDFGLKRVEILQIADKFLMVNTDDTNLRISPSFKLMIKEVIDRNEFQDEIKFTSITNDKLHAEFYVEKALDSKDVRKFVQVMRKWKETKPKDYKFKPIKEPDFLIHVIKSIENEFQPIFHNNDFDENHLKKSLDVCKFIAELYSSDLYSAQDYESCIKKVAGLGKKIPTIFKLRCFEFIAMNNLEIMQQKHDFSLDTFCKKTFIELKASVEFTIPAEIYDLNNEDENAPETVKKKRKRR